MGRSAERRRHHRATNHFLGRGNVEAVIKRTPGMLRPEEVTRLLSTVDTVSAEGDMKYEFPQNRIVTASQNLTTSK